MGEVPLYNTPDLVSERGDLLCEADGEEGQQPPAPATPECRTGFNYPECRQLNYNDPQLNHSGPFP